MPPPPPPRPPAAEQPQLHGVVIITLPPPDQPSNGKTITAFTYTDDPPPPPAAPARGAPAVARARRTRRALSPRRVAAMALVLGALAVAAYYCFYSDVAVQFLGMEEEEAQRERNETRSFLLPLYPKARQGRALREFGDVKLAARRVDDGGGRKPKARNKMEVSKAAAAGTNSTALLPIKGNVFPDGQYYTSIFVGNPPRPYFLDVDTGSDLTWIQCDAPCTNCAKGPHPLYKPAKEKIVPPQDSLCQQLQGNQNYCETCKQCDYEIEYADQSSSMGVLAKDDMHLIATNGGREKLDFVFGCAYDQQGQLLASPAKTDGILGLSNAAISFPSQLASQGIISNVFGHCITRELGGGGYMFLGDDYVPRWGMTWTSIRNGLDNFYHTEVQNVKYGDQQLSVREQAGKSVQVIFDSGSSYTYLPNEIYGSLVAAIKHVATGFVQDSSDRTLPLCWKADSPVRYLGDVKQVFKPFSLHFGKKWLVMSKTFTISPEDYLIISEKGNVCLGLLNGTEINHGSTIIVGDVSLRGKLVVYDNERRQIGWANSDCTKPQTQKGFPFFL